MVELIPSHPEYAELWMRWRSEPNTVRFNPIAQTPLQELRERMRRMGTDLRALEGAEEFQFFMRHAGQLVGSVTFKGVSRMMAYAEIAYDVGQAYQGRGIGSAGVKAFVGKVFAETSLRRLIAYVTEDNIASRRVLRKAGFVQEGILREHYVINGTPTNEVMYGLLRSDPR
jgi:RimJ/RimL family protein N-acetyltransferase